jgi:hypothetical protein
VRLKIDETFFRFISSSFMIKVVLESLFEFVCGDISWTGKMGVLNEFAVCLLDVLVCFLYHFVFVLFLFCFVFVSPIK